MPRNIIKTDALVQRPLWLVKLTKTTAFRSVPLYESLICKLGIGMHSSLCADEISCIKAELYKGNLVCDKYLMLNMTLKKKQLNLIPTQHLFLSLDLNMRQTACLYHFIFLPKIRAAWIKSHFP